MKINFCDLGKQYELLKDRIDRRIDNVIKHTNFVKGPEIQELEKELAKFLGIKHAIAVSSGTDALLISLSAINIQPGDFVITTPFSFIASAEVISFLKAIPIFVDISQDTYNISAEAIKEFFVNPNHPAKGTIPLDKIKAVIAVDLYGQPAGYDEINKLAREHKFYIIEDGCQSFGATYKNKKAGALGDINCTSFFPAKPLGCYGDGGAVFTNDDKLAEKVKLSRDHGQDKRYHHKIIGLNARLDTIQAAILLAKLDTFIKEEIGLREQVAQGYNQRLRQLAQGGKIILPQIKLGNQSVWSQYSLRILDGQRDDLKEYLTQKGIPTAIHYPRPLHLQEAFNFLGYQKGDFPIAEKVSGEIISLPMHAYLTDEETEYIGIQISTFFQGL